MTAALRPTARAQSCIPVRDKSQPRRMLRGRCAEADHRPAGAASLRRSAGNACKSPCGQEKGKHSAPSDSRHEVFGDAMRTGIHKPALVHCLHCLQTSTNKILQPPLALRSPPHSCVEVFWLTHLQAVHTHQQTFHHASMHACMHSCNASHSITQTMQCICMYVHMSIQ
eukprot:1158434-Pelagomonas_calceolata.AAC.6